MSSLAHDTQWVDAIDQAELVRSGKVTPVELLDAAIERAEQLNPAINALTFTWFDKAREIARNLPTNSAMPLRGVPFILKDLHAAMKGLPLSNGNKAMKAAALNSNYTADIVQRFINAGLVIFGRGNSPEFGSVPTTEPEAWGPTRNPWDTNRMAGGSSGGSAAAVAAGIVPAAHATDGGGSVRIPAACCGLVGLKVSQGRITGAPLRDETNLGVEHVVSRTVRDTAAVLDVICGYESGDPYMAPPFARPLSEEVGVSPGRLRIGILDHPLFGFQLDDAESRASVARVADQLTALGHDVSVAWPEHLNDESCAGKFTAIVAAWTHRDVSTFEAILGRTIGEGDLETRQHSYARNGPSSNRRNVFGKYGMATCMVQASGAMVGTN